MAKDPAFLFYSQDFIVGIQTMNFEDRGKYITILCQMHQQGRLDEETISFMVGSVSVRLKNKFKVDEDGRWYNERLELEAEKRRNFVQSRVDNGLRGGRPVGKKKPIGKPTDNLTEDEDVNVNVSKKIVNKYVPSEVVVDVIEHLNHVTGKNFSIMTESHGSYINKLVSKGRKLDDFKKVIETKYEEWKDDEMSKYLRPETLFAGKFDSYLNQIPVNTNSYSKMTKL